MNSVRSNNLSLIFHRVPSGCTDLEIRKFEFVTKILFLYLCLF